MKKTISISRPANGSGTVVTVTVVEDGITSKFAYKASATTIASAIETATKHAEDMLRQAREAVDSDGQ